MDKLLDLLYSKNPGTTILLSTLLTNNNAETDSRAKIINKQYRDIVEKRRKLNQRIVLAEMYESDTPWISKKDLVDGTHPTDAGYKRMATIWWNAFLEADKGRMLQPPTRSTMGNGVRCEEQFTSDLSKQITTPQNFLDPVQPVQPAKIFHGNEAVWRLDGQGIYVYQLNDGQYTNGAVLDIKTNCWAKGK